VTVEPNTAPQMSEARRYQQLRAHRSYLKLGDAAEHLPRVLDAARAEIAVIRPVSSVSSQARCDGSPVRRV
jgi:hypothetical protein